MKSLLAVADGGPALEATLATAAAYAAAVGAQLDVLHARDTMALVGAIGVVGLPEGADSPILEASDETMAVRAKEAREAYARLLGSSTSARWIEEEANEADTVVTRGRLTDLVVVGRPGSDPEKPEPAYVGAALFEAARPVLIVPPAHRGSAVGSAVVAWNGSAQAARALGYAIPLLAKATSVVVLSVGSAKDRAPTDAAVAYLALHGVKAAGEAFDPGSGSARARGRALLNYVDEKSTGLLVMGAYGQGAMMRFLGLGGATAKVITACKSPVLLAH